MLAALHQVRTVQSPGGLSVCTGRAEVQRIWNVFLALGLSNHAGPPRHPSPNGLSSPPALGPFPLRPFADTKYALL